MLTPEDQARQELEVRRHAEIQRERKRLADEMRRAVERVEQYIRFGRVPDAPKPGKS